MAGKYLSLLVHFTWSTQNREPWIEPGMRDDMYAFIGGKMNQEKHHAKRTFKEELVSLLEKHEIPYDLRYIWK